MVDQRKRGFSSFSDDSTDSNEGRIKRILKYFLPKSLVERSQKKSTKSTSNLNDQTASIIQNNPLVSDFPERNGNWDKKYPRADSIPRSGSGLHTDLVYENLQNKVKEGNHFERANGLYQGALIKPEAKDVTNPAASSPNFNILDTLSVEHSGRSDEHPENLFDTEIAPSYGVSEEGLVRPPLINLDPRERFHLLQIKKSLETTETLQNRLKYMIDPHETHSFILNDNNKTDSSTQTHGQDFLDNTLISSHLNRKRRAQTDTNLSKRPKNSRGYFNGDFFYDDIDSKKSKEIEGKTFLGSLNKPKFTNKENKRENTDDELYNRYAENNMKTTTDRTGLDELLLKNQKAKVTLDPDFLKHTQKVADAIKLRDVKNDNKRREPSPGFNFTINENDIASAFKKRPSPNKEEAQPQKESEDKGEVLKEAPHNGHANPLFSENKQSFFGKTNEPSDGKPSLFAQPAPKADEQQKQKHPGGNFNFLQQGNGNASSLFNFSNKKLNITEVSENKKENSEDEQPRKRTAAALPEPNKPLFSFGDQSKKANNDGFAFSFSKDTSSKATQSSFSGTGLGHEKKDEVFTGGDKGSSDKDTPLPSTESGNGTSFDKTTQEVPKNTNQLPFPFSFGSITKPSEGAESRAQSPATDQSHPGSRAQPQPAFSLSAKKANENQNYTKPFSFPPKPKEPSPSAPSVPSSKFSFGAPSGQTNSQPGTSTAPSFNFTGMVGKGPSPDPASIFGGASNQPFSAPTQSTATPPPVANQFQPPTGVFGLAASSNAPPSFPSFTFGAPQATNFTHTTSSSAPPNLRTSTPPFNRKIAQIRRRR